MSQQPLQLTVRGVRGSVTTPGPQMMRHGGHTTCLELAFSPRRRLLLDCGSGLHTLQAELPANAESKGLRFDIFLTHYHFDHLEGLRFFRPLYDPEAEFVFHGPPWAGGTVREAVEGSMAPPWFPVPLQKTASRKRFVELGPQPLTIEGLSARWAAVSHPQGAVAYRIERRGRSVVLATDCEPGDAACERGTQRLFRDADVLIHDAQYTPDEYASRRGWGHSSWRHAVRAAERSRARRLILFHHDPLRTDEQLDRIVTSARREFAETEAAREGMQIRL
jgi:phosphoribosyl 1,2-cyclic phosphodiesterase